MSMTKNALSRYHDDCLKEIAQRQMNGEANIASANTIFDMKYFTEAKNALGEAVAKKNTYNPTPEWPV
jgi:hypothetical protein